MTHPGVRERPITFSDPLIPAILDGRKTQTRRLMNPQPVLMQGDGKSLRDWSAKYDNDGPSLAEVCSPYGVPGDRLWVRHSFYLWRPPSNPGNIQIWDEFTKCARWPDGRCIENCEPNRENGSPWLHKPSIHMPRWASRITLEITDVRVQRVQEISEEDARAEGRSLIMDSPSGYFPETWDSIYAKRGFGWALNPWVWATSFRRVS